MHINTQPDITAAQESRSGTARDTLATWKRLIDANAASSKEIDALSNAEASQYVEQRRQFEPQSANALSAFSCR